ncbi:Uncharacterised protein at_DN0524 [Pycnogonum litorale]
MVDEKQVEEAKQVEDKNQQTTSNDENMIVVAKKRCTVAQRRFTRLWNALDRELHEEDVTIETINDQLRDVESAYSEVAKRTDEFQELVESEDEDAQEFDDRLSNVYDKLCSVRSKVHKLKESENKIVKDKSRNSGVGVDLSKVLHAQQNLPRPELSEFNGECENYMNFITNFECHVAAHCEDGATKLAYLIQLCGSSVKPLIEHYAMETDGYKKARERLEEKYAPHRGSLYNKMYENKKH